YAASVNTWHAFLFFEYNDTSHFFRPVIACGSVLFLRFELTDERSELRGDGAREGVVLVLEALPNRREHNASVPSRFALVFGLRGMSSVAVAKCMPTNPIVYVVGCLSRGGDCRHGGCLP